MSSFPVEKVVTVPQATPSSDGLMSASDKTKLDNMTGGGGGGIDLRDEGSLVRPGTAFLDFRGNGVTASADGVVTIPGTASGVETFNGRTGAVVFQQADGDAFFLTPAEGDVRYAPIGSGAVTSVFGRTGAVVAQQTDYDAFFLTPAEGNAAYLTQAQANAQGMPAVELGAVGSGLPITRISANVTLLPATEGSRFWQFYFNTDTASHDAIPPSGYTIVGSTAIAAGTGALFIKAAGAQTFYRVN